MDRHGGRARRPDGDGRRPGLARERRRRASARAPAAAGRHRSDGDLPAQRRLADGHRLGDRLRPDRARRLRPARRGAGAVGSRRVRVLLTGGSGFVGSNLAHVFATRHDAEMLAPGHDDLDLADPGAVGRHVASTRPQAIVHAAIWNEPAGLLSDRRRAWAGYVGATRNVVDAANAAGAHVVLISTDWVFDGTQGPAAEDEPPNPINAYGFLKAASELVVGARAERGTVARIAAVQGIHRARPASPRAQDAGFGYLVASIVDA